MTDSRTEQDLLVLLTERSTGVTSLDEMSDLARRLGEEEGFASNVVDSLIAILGAQQNEEPSETANAVAPMLVVNATRWSLPLLRVDWGDEIGVGRQACPQFFLNAPAEYDDEPRVELVIDSRLDFESAVCSPDVMREDDNLWTFDVPFSMTTAGDDCRPGRYRIEVHVAYPHVGHDCPWYFSCTIRLNVADPNGGGGPTLEIEGDGQSIINLHGGDLGRFSTVRLKGGDRSIVNLQDLKPGGGSEHSAAANANEDRTLHEYPMQVDERRQRRRPVISSHSRSGPSTGRLAFVMPDGRRTLLYCQRSLSIGRAGTNDIRTYFLPRDKEHDKLTRGISGAHATLRLSDTGLEIRDENSRYGLALSGQRIEDPISLTHADADEDHRLSLASELKKNALHTQLRLFSRPPRDKFSELQNAYCDVFRLRDLPKLWRLAESTSIDAVRLRRTHNLTEEEYVTIFCQATIGTSIHAAIQLTGGSVIQQHARVLAVGADFWLENLGPEDSVQIDEKPLKQRELVQLIAGRSLSIGDVTIAIEEFGQMHLS